MDRSIKKAWTAEKLRYIGAFNFRLLKLTAFAWWQCFVSIKFVASILDYFKKLRIEMINTQRNINKLDNLNNLRFAFNLALIEESLQYVENRLNKPADISKIS